jgi:hypothetical protein
MVRIVKSVNGSEWNRASFRTLSRDAGDDLKRTGQAHGFMMANCRLCP